MRKISQDKASSVCGFSRPTIGHIENGRIMIDQKKINHIVKSFGFKMAVFEKYCKAEITRDVIVEDCKRKIMDLSDEKLGLIKGIIDSMG